MKQGGQRGFTIIEISLFVTISALLFAGLISGITYMVDRSRFSTSVNNLESLMRSQYEEVRSGINDRSTAATNICSSDPSAVAPGSSNCLLLGKIIRFTPGSSNISINYVIGDANVAIPSTATDSDAIYAVTPRFSAIAQETSQIQWQSNFIKAVRIEGSTVPFASISSIAILRSPVSSAIVVYAVSSGVTTAGTTLTSANSTANVSTGLLIKNTGRGQTGGAVCVNTGASSANIGTAIPSDPSLSYGIGSSELTKLKEQCSQ